MRVTFYILITIIIFSSCHDTLTTDESIYESFKENKKEYESLIHSKSFFSNENKIANPLITICPNELEKSEIVFPDKVESVYLTCDSTAIFFKTYVREEDYMLDWAHEYKGILYLEVADTNCISKIFLRNLVPETDSYVAGDKLREFCNTKWHEIWKFKRLNANYYIFYHREAQTF